MYLIQSGRGFARCHIASGSQYSLSGKDFNKLEGGSYAPHEPPLVTGLIPYKERSGL